MTGHKDHTLFRQWIVNCSAGELIGIGVAGSVALLLNTLMGEPQALGQKLLVLLVMVLAGAAEGSSVSWFQWRVLRKWYPRMKFQGWWKTTTAAAVIGWLLGMIPSLFLVSGTAAAGQPSWLVILLMAAGGGAVAGAMFGGFQFLELRKHTRRAGWWMVANAAAWSLAMCVIFIGATWPSATTPAGWIVISALVSGCVAGLLLGGVTGWFLRHKIIADPFTLAH